MSNLCDLTKLILDFLNQPILSNEIYFTSYKHMIKKSHFTYLPLIEKVILFQNYKI